MAKVNNEESKEEGEISDEDDSNENSTSKVDENSHLLSDTQTFSAAPTQFIGRSNRQRQKTGSAKFLRGSKTATEPRNNYRNRLPSPKRVLPSLMQVRVNPSRDLLQKMPERSHLLKPQLAVNRKPKPESRTERESVRLQPKTSEHLPKQSPGARCILWSVLTRP